MKNQKGSLPIIALVIITLILIIGLLIFFIKNSQKIQFSQPLPTPIPLTQNQPQPTSSQMGLKFDNPPAKADPFSDTKGPFYHQVFMAASLDGLNFMKEDNVLFDQTSVPDIIRLPSGRLLVYVVDGARRSKSGLMMALSDDNGKSWDLGSVQFKTKDGTAGGGADPEVVLLKDGTLRLYYVRFSGPPQPNVVSTTSKNWVKSAVSSDGINFEEEDGVRFEYSQITDPDVVNVNGKWFMYLSQGPKLIATSSDDGLTFTLEKTIREKGSALPAGRQVSNTVYVDVDFWRQFFCADGKIQSAKTADGLNFQDEPGFRLEPDSGKLICDPAPVHLGGSWLMLYKVAQHQ